MGNPRDIQYFTCWLEHMKYSDKLFLSIKFWQKWIGFGSLWDRCRYYWLLIFNFWEFPLTDQANQVFWTCQLYLVTEENIYIICDFFSCKSIAADHGNICTYMHISFALATIHFTYANKFKLSEIWISSQIFCTQTKSTATLTELLK